MTDILEGLLRVIADVCFNKPHSHSTKDIYEKIGKCETKVTQCVLKEMFCENTGSHFLDSGGAYGRGWQRCQAIKEQDWMEAEMINVEVDSYRDGEHYVYMTKNTYLFLCEHLVYDIVMDKQFHQFFVFPIYIISSIITIIFSE